MSSTIDHAPAKRHGRRSVRGRSGAGRLRGLLEPLEQRVFLSTATLSNGNGDGTLQLTVDGYGSFGSYLFPGTDAMYDPPGAELGRAGTTGISALYFGREKTYLRVGASRVKAESQFHVSDQRYGGKRVQRGGVALRADAVRPSAG
jgi:hypothetical protein